MDLKDCQHSGDSGAQKQSVTKVKIKFPCVRSHVAMSFSLTEFFGVGVMVQI